MANVKNGGYLETNFIFNNETILSAFIASADINYII